MPDKSNTKVLELQFIKGIGPKRAQGLAEIGIYTFQDLMFYFPRDYVRRESVKSFKSLALELKGESPVFELNASKNTRREVTIVCKIDAKNVKSIGPRKKILEIRLDDMHGGFAFVVFWSYVEFFAKKYDVGSIVVVTGKVELDKIGRISFNHPEIQRFSPEESDLFSRGSIVPVYKMPQELVRSGWDMNLLRSAIRITIESFSNLITDNLSADIINKYNFDSMISVVRQLHSPDSIEIASQSLIRLKFEEVFFFELLLEAQRSKTKRIENAPAISPKSPLARKLYNSLGFELTPDQKKVIREITNDMADGKPMNRLLQGDVGSGKTIVAILCMLSAIDNGYQVAIMAPTEILAEQHFANIRKYTELMNINIVQLVGGQKTKNRNDVKSQIADGSAQIICGTHAMFFSDIQYNKLGLIVVDEQHRFGVQQRAKLKELASASFSDFLSPHILVMSATPIPRTLSLTLYGDLDVSVIRTMPKGRLPIKTKVAFESQLDSVYDFIRSEIEIGRQAYIIYPLVEESDKLEFKAAVTQFDKLSSDIFPDFKCGLIHGQMAWNEKEEAMHDFLNKKFQILVATTVIEVGIDVPNASVIMINDAERFGLATLHQLRGRVGRGNDQSYCILATKDNYRYQLKKIINDDNLDDFKAAIVRLRTMESTTDGFEISEVDLKLRGPGDVLGTRQSGLPDFKFIDLARDLDIITNAKYEAARLISTDPNLSQKANEPIRKEFLRKYHDESYLGIA